MSNLFFPYPHQTIAWNKMDNHYLNYDKDRGMVVVPTGGGKTTLATKWILDNLLNKHSKGYRIIWLAHRIELLEQARDTFIKFGISPSSTAVVSSSNRTWSSISSNISFVFSGDKSAYNSLNYIENFILESNKGVFVVVDECHHSVASQYKEVLCSIYKNRCYKDIKILGLTATPSRMNPNETQLLWRMYDDSFNLDNLNTTSKSTDKYNSIIYEVSSNELINKNILAKPIPVTVKTEENFENEFSESDFSKLSESGDLGNYILDKISKSSSRNKLIVNYYKNNINKYGKTIVFAINIAHCITLQEEFIQVGIKCEYVASGKDDNNYIINKFKYSDDIKVLISVIKLTEGFDCPDIQTVFLTRPTSSEVLFRQMIGRGLRGPIAGGTKDCYLVTFVDSWDIFSPLNSEILLAPEEYKELENEKTSNCTPTELIDSEIIRYIYSIIRNKFNSTLLDTYEALPYGWYQWTEEDEAGEKEQLVMLYKSYFDEFELLINKFKSKDINTNINSKNKLQHLSDMYFGDCCEPLPQLSDIYKVLNAINKGIELNMFTFDAKEHFNPIELAKKFEDLSRPELYDTLYNIFESNELCQKTYKYIFETFYNEVSRYIDKSLSLKNTVKNIPIECDYSKKSFLNRFDGDGYNLYALREAILLNPDGSFNKTLFPEGLNAEYNNYNLSFTKKGKKSYFGICRYSDKSIKLNKILNSPDIPRFVVEFVLYHEMLHTVLPNNSHDKVFKEREAKFIPSKSAQHDAQQRGIIFNDKVRNFWQTRATQVLDSLKYDYDLSIEYI